MTSIKTAPAARDARMIAAVSAAILPAMLPIPDAFAQAFPARPIRLLIPASPGGPADIVARIVAQNYGEAIGQPLVADNRAGAGGGIGAEIVARSQPDGYTVMISHSGPLAIEPLRQSKPSYDPLRDFTPLSLVAEQAYMLLVHPSVQAKTVQELVALARSRPGKMNFASGGPGTGIHMAAELFNLVAALKVTHVPYKGAGPGMGALIGGEVDMMFNGISSALPQVRAGKLRALAMAGTKRSNLLPELPTIQEAGFKYDTSGWYGFVGPAGLPKPIVARLNEALVKTLASAEVRERFSAQGIDGIGSTPAAFADFLREEMAKWRKVIVASGLKGD
ncbi:MAG: tripartite tricarboxylate transporter substrate binding protein [Betaproteobacteria bacterium]|jgi:tripartite-type tricarboxylate transporter receptor subunit TctC|nr:tripartite tricarboxylate transporter substrate binding protein [Betaproteobacteria bacterium]